MNIGLLTESEAIAQMWRYVDSRDWWIIPWISEAASHLCQEIESRYYSGDASADFILMTCPPDRGAFAVAFAHKRQMTSAQLAGLMCDYASVDVTAEVLDRQDIVIAVDTSSDPEQRASISRVLTWQAWMQANRERDAA